MSQQRCFSVIGDSNVRRNMTSLNRRASPLMEGCQIISCRKVSNLADSLRSIRATSNSCIISCITNFLTDLSSRSKANVQSRVEPVFEDVRAALSDYREANPDMLVLVAPPMYRAQPEWYHDNLSEILQLFSKILSPLRSQTLQLLPGFAGVDLEDDGVHLTAYAGLKFVVHLFDSSLDAIKSLTSPVPEGLARVSEVSRVLEDRVSVLEQDQSLLRHEFQLKSARDSELADFEENVRNECYFVISGLPQVPTDLVGRAWQDHAKGLVQDKIKLILGRESKIVVVSGLRRDENPVYLVKLESVDDSKRIRDKFGSAFKAGAAPLPPGLKGLSIRIRLTHATRVRIAILQAFASNYKAANPGAKVQVVNFEPRPLLRLTPPAGASDQRTMTFNFIEAVTKLPARFHKKDLAQIMKSTSGKFKGQLRTLFVVLSDDQRSQVQVQDTRAEASSRDRSASPSDSSEGSESEAESVPNENSNVSRHSTSTRVEPDQRCQSAGNSSETRTSGRGSKRGPPSPDRGRGKTKARR